MRVRAAVLRSLGASPPYTESKPLVIETLDLAPPREGEVLVKIAAAGLCHSDLSVINGDRPRPVPMALGHEAAGTVLAVGAGVCDLVPGDHVVTIFMPSCGRCLPCAEGHPALCEPGTSANLRGELLGGGRRLSQHGSDVNHHLGCSAFAECAVLSRRSLVKIDPDVSFCEAALFGCSILTGVGAVVNAAAVKPGQSVVVVGLGGVGLASVLGAVVAGAGRICAVDISDSKLQLARSLGATSAVNANADDAIEQVLTLTDGGAHYAFEMAGVARALESALKMTRRGGTTITAGLPRPDARVSISPVSLVVEERTLKGSYIGSCVPARDLPRYLALYRSGRLPVDRLVSGYLPLEDINAGFDRLREGRAVRQVVRIDA